MKLLQLLLFSLILPNSSTAQVEWSSRTGQPGISGSSDLTNGTARFSLPAGVARDASGNLYVADSLNHTIRKISGDGNVTTLAGVDGTSGSDDGPASSALFSGPAGVATDHLGNIYVADELNHTIRRLAPTGMVTTVAGKAGTSGSSDGMGSAARFNRPRGVAVDKAGILYVTDSFNYTIRRIDHAGVVTTLAGSAGQWGGTNGGGSVARFATPLGICVQPGGGDGNPTCSWRNRGRCAKSILRVWFLR